MFQFLSTLFRQLFKLLQPYGQPLDFIITEDTALLRNNLKNVSFLFPGFNRVGRIFFGNTLVGLLG